MDDNAPRRKAQYVKARMRLPSRYRTVNFHVWRNLSPAA
jgi:hypothetical protein